MGVLERAQRLSAAHEALIVKYGRPLANLLVHGAQIGFWIDAAVPSEPIVVPSKALADLLDNFQFVFQSMLEGTNLFLQATAPLLVPEGKTFGVDELNEDVKNIYEIMLASAQEEVAEIEAAEKEAPQGATLH